MPKKKCPNGHIYDSTIYGDSCPLCPPGTGDSYSNTGTMSNDFDASSTRINVPGNLREEVAGGNTGGGIGSMESPQVSNFNNQGGVDASGQTKLSANQGVNHGGAKPLATMIRPPKGVAKTNGRKLVGFLVTYNRFPMGKSFEIYEGKNYIGRDASADISIPDDNQISGRHMMILYRNIDNKFKYRDEQSSNGTFVNKDLSDEGELHNYDIIRLGNTVFIFIAIPQV